MARAALVTSAVVLGAAATEYCLRSSGLPRWIEAVIAALSGITLGLIIQVAIFKRRLDQLAAAYKDHDQIYREARLDPLTQIPNRRGFEGLLRRAAASTTSPDQILALVYFDLDGFKPVNDRYGHAAGDDVLRKFAERLLTLQRPGTSVARQGGDEFVILLVGESRATLCAEAERMVQLLGADPYEVGGDKVRMTVSAGLAYVEPGMQLPTILRNADQAVYEAKRLGSNRLVVFEKSAYRKANEDPLTGLYNRRYLDAHLPEEIATVENVLGHSALLNPVLTIVLIDIDDFGNINRTYGYPTADLALKRFADVAGGCIRETDWIARYGGDEFCLVMPDADVKIGLSVAERVRAAIADQELRSVKGDKFSITISAGVVQRDPACAGVVDLLQAASDAVFEAKHRGGNCVVAGRCGGDDQAEIIAPTRQPPTPPLDDAEPAD